jgi:hypothetical protein
MMGHVISLASFRARRSGPASSATDQTSSTGPARRFLAALLVVALTVVVGGISLGHRQPGDVEQVAGLSPQQRASWFARTRADVTEGCADVRQSAGVLRQHCADQARFLLLFPECDPLCRSVALRLLPPGHAGR